VVADTLGALLGGEQQVSSSEEIAWAFRKLLETVANATPLVCVFDDVHWGEETFLDLIEHVADLSRDAPILLLCMARPDLLDRRTGWAGGKVNATSVLLEPLEAAETEQLIESLAHVEEGLRDRILEAAEGNPLYVEEMVSFVRASGGGEITVPPTIQALLAARLDQLDASERSVLERGAVEGRTFHRGAVQALVPEEPQVLARLTSLVRKELVRPDRAQLAGEDAFRFRHLLIRDAAYEALPKAVRAELHKRFADWLTEHGRDLVELDEILGYHLEQATRYRQELGSPATEHDRDVAARGAGRLCAAGERALARRDLRAGANLLGRGLALLEPEARALELEWKFVLALMEAGDLPGARREADGLAARGAASGDRRVELYGLLVSAFVASQADTASTDSLQRLAEEARTEFEATGDELGIGLAWFALAHVLLQACRWQEVQGMLERTHLHGVRAHDAYLQEQSLQWMSAVPVYGPMPTDEGLRWYDAHDEWLEGIPILASMRANVEAMVGNFGGARALIRDATARLEELGQRLWLAAFCQQACAIEMLAGDPEAAAREGIRGCRALEAIGERGWLSTVAGQTAHALLELGRDDEAEHWIGVAAASGSPDDVITRTLTIEVEAKLCSRRGDHAEAAALARAAVALIAQTDMLEATADARLTLAGVLHATGDDAEAIEQIEKAVELYKRKRHLVGAARARSLLASARSPAQQ
jgi:tetratricopeptide (TPR) repeat protein